MSAETALQFPLHAPPIYDLGGAVHNVCHRRYGARGDGSTPNQHERFYDAIDDLPAGGGTVLVPPGDYLWGDNCVVGKSKVRIVLMPGARIVIDASSVKAFDVKHADGVTYIEDFELYGGHFFDPDPAAHTGVEESHGVVFTKVRRAKLYDWTTENLGDEHFDIGQSLYVTLRDGTVIGGPVVSSAGGAVSFNNSRFCRLLDCDFEGSGDTQGQAFRIEATVADLGFKHGGHKIRGVNVKDWGPNACVISNGQDDIYDVQFEHMHFRDCSRAAILSVPAADRYVYGLSLNDINVRGGGELADTGGGVHRGAVDLRIRTVKPSIGIIRVSNWGADAQGHHGVVMQDGTGSDIVVHDAADCGVYVADTDDGGILDHVYATDCGLRAPSGARSAVRVGANSRVDNSQALRCHNGFNSPEDEEAADSTGSEIVNCTARDCTNYGFRMKGAGVVRGGLSDGNAYGIVLSGTGPEMIDLEIRDSTTQDVLDSSSGTATKRSSRGDWRNEGTGTVTLTNGSTTVDIVHGLQGDPQVKDLAVGAIEDMGSATKFWTSYVNSSTLRIHVDQDPGQDVDFRYHIRVL